MKYLSLLFLILAASAASAQQNIIVCGDAYQFPLRPLVVSVLSVARNPVDNEFKYLAYIPVGLNDKFYVKIPFDKPKLIMIHYAGGSNMVYACPGDSIHVRFTEIARVDTFESMVLTHFYKERWHYSGNDSARIAFFETIVEKTGIVDDPPFKMDTEQPCFLVAYKARILSIYKQRQAILDSLDRKNHFNNDFKVVAANELKGEYLNGLLNLCLLDKQLKFRRSILMM